MCQACERFFYALLLGECMRDYGEGGRYVIPALNQSSY